MGSEEVWSGRSTSAYERAVITRSHGVLKGNSFLSCLPYPINSESLQYLLLPLLNHVLDSLIIWKVL